MICNDSGECLAIGHIVKEKIKFMFNYFNDFEFADLTAKKISKASGNAFAYEISYSRNQYHSSTLLKSSLEILCDNLYYEYIVGKQFINKMNNFFPCFTETYMIYKQS